MKERRAREAGRLGLGSPASLAGMDQPSWTDRVVPGAAQAGRVYREMLQGAAL